MACTPSLPLVAAGATLTAGAGARAAPTADEGEGEDDLAAAGAEKEKPATALREFAGYVRANATAIPNYGDRHRNAEAISSAFVESTVNQVVSKRMVKKQQKRWTPRGAHLLLRVRTRVLNDELAAAFRRWYPAFSHTIDQEPVVA